MTNTEYHQYTRPIRNVAIIGAGAAGSPAARHLRDAGLRVRVFERQPTPGGIWNWSPDITLPLSVPTPPPSRGAFFPATPSTEPGPQPLTVVLDDTHRGIRHRFSPPNPVYWSLSNNVPTSTMAFKDYPYPPGTKENIPHTDIAGYVHAYARHFGLDALACYNTRVERAVKVKDDDSQGDKWRLTLRRVVPEGDDRVQETFWTEDFDALVVATGHYNAPFIPDIEGSAAWAAAWPERLLHSSGYRVPEPYKGKDVLIVGIGTSGIDIARDLSPHVNKVYMVGKERIHGPDGYQNMRRFQRKLLPKANGELLPEIRRFHPPVLGAPFEEGRIELTSGRIITNISLVIFATGYQYSYPFLPQFHHDPATSGEIDAQTKANLLVTDGTSLLNLYRDVFFIPDPTLAFLGLSVNTSAFSFFEYQSLAIARVFSGTARLPNLVSRRAAYEAHVAERGDGKFTHFMGKEGERVYVRDTVAWLNRDAEWSGAPRVEGHSPQWIAASDAIQGSIAARYGLDPSEYGPPAKEETKGALSQAVLQSTSQEDDTDPGIALGGAQTNRVGPAVPPSVLVS